jgi:hypothetical protein
MRLVKAVVLVATVGLGAALTGCDDGAEPPGPVDVGRRRAPVEETARFVGAWQAVSGTLVASCPGYASSTGSVARRLKWSEAVGSDLVQTQEGVACVVNANVAGSTASGSGPACTVSEGGADAIYTVQAYTFVIAPDGESAQEDLSATVTTTVDGKALTCPISVTAVYRKAGT